ncbi:hypothetical protein LINPERHAP2_LOCUS4833 [Linum perenne]
MNQAYMAKLVFRFFQDPSLLWIQVL